MVLQCGGEWGRSCFIVSQKAALMQVLDGADGAKAQDDLWPAFHKSDVHASPIMVDFDYDGVLDILLATSNGELLVVKDTVRPSPTQPEHPCIEVLQMLC